MLKLQGVSASYGSVPAITDVSIEIGEGEAVGLLGANGAGKSTTLRAISGLVKLRAGSDARSVPAKVMVPDDIFTRLEMARNVVLLPAPLAPSKPTASPSPISMLTL